MRALHAKNDKSKRWGVNSGVPRIKIIYNPQSGREGQGKGHIYWKAEHEAFYLFSTDFATNVACFVLIAINMKKRQEHWESVPVPERYPLPELGF